MLEIWTRSRPLRATRATNSIIIDVCDGAALRELFNRHRPAGVIHLAAESLGHWSSLPSGEQSQFRFLRVSTDEVLGSLGGTGHFDESTRYAPNSSYSASKAASDHFVQAWHKTYGLPTIISNCSNNYGPCQFPEKLIPLAIQRARWRVDSRLRARRECAGLALRGRPYGGASTAL